MSGSTCSTTGLFGKAPARWKNSLRSAQYACIVDGVVQVGQDGLLLAAAARQRLVDHVVGEDRRDPLRDRVLDVVGGELRRPAGSRWPSRCRCSRRPRGTGSGSRTAPSPSSRRRRRGRRRARAGASSASRPAARAGRPARARPEPGANGSMPSDGMSAAISSRSASAALLSRRYMEEASRAAVHRRAHWKNDRSIVRVTKRSGRPPFGWKSGPVTGSVGLPFPVRSATLARRLTESGRSTRYADAG